jgi:hypothetical protein
MSSDDTFLGEMYAWNVRLDAALAARLPHSDAAPADLHAAMRASVLNDRPRIYSVLMFEVARMLGVKDDSIEAAACALELIYMCVRTHERLSALRVAEDRAPAAREDEATALLIGDSLVPLAFQLICDDPALPQAPQVRLELTQILGSATAMLYALAQRSEQHDPTSAISSSRSLYRASLQMALICSDGVPSSHKPLLAELERSVGASWDETYATLAKLGEQGEWLRVATQWLEQRERDEYVI